MEKIRIRIPKILYESLLAEVKAKNKKKAADKKKIADKKKKMAATKKVVDKKKSIKESIKQVDLESLTESTLLEIYKKLVENQVEGNSKDLNKR